MSDDPLLNPPLDVQLARLRADYATRGVALEHALKTIDESAEQVRKDAEELVSLVAHCNDPECKGKWCVTARAFIEKYQNVW